MSTPETDVHPAKDLHPGRFGSRRAGGAFLIEDTGVATVLTPEMFDEEQRALLRTTEDFASSEVVPKAREIEEKKPGVLVALMKRAGESGFLMADVPERFGGLGLPKTSSALITQGVRRIGSFSVTIGAHTGIGTLPLVYYGNDAQKAKYLPKLASGEWLAAYALTEAGSGSDALAARTTAQLTADGKHWRLNGVKQWITNAAFADLFTVFAQVDGKKFTAFLVERTTPGVSVGPEEHKMGIRGSSTCELILQDVLVPVENVLGEIGRGHKIAFNTLNVGRLKLGVGTIGAARYALELAIQFAQERKQFGKALVEFGLIRQKLGKMATLIFVGEAMSFRTTGLIDAATSELAADAPDHDAQEARILEEFAAECSIIKVFGSETLDYVSDEGLQIHGGYGFTEEYPIERVHRDSRINRIFEGTNEINRILIPVMLLKRAMNGMLDLLGFAQKVREELEGGRPLETPKGPLGYERRAADVMRRVTTYMANLAVEKYAMELQERQAVLGTLSDMIIDTYALDSAVARASQAVEQFGVERASLYIAMAKVFAHDAQERVLDGARLLAAEMAEGDELKQIFERIARLPGREPVKYFALIDSVAAGVIADGGVRWLA